MKRDLVKKYTPYPKFHFPERTWPNNTLKKAPIWCSVDLRDGNQALVSPMNLDQKIQMFKLLVQLGFKEIEVGFPSASAVEFEFCRTLIEKKLIPEDVTIQILCQCREHLIEKSFAALKGAKNIIFHIYNSTSIAQRKMVFGKSKEEIRSIATQGVKWVKQYSKKYKTQVTLQYSPESFTGTETDYALEICEAVIKEWGSKEKVIINLPSTVELTTPNVYADQIEWFAKHLKNRSQVILSLHTHNDRGEGVAATELGLLAGADRVEGTLFGNGERTGNLDIVTVALNLYTQGIDPKLNLHNIDKIVNVYESCTNMSIPERHPYAGSLVFTAFSGSHQDAINKGLAYQRKHKEAHWEVPYLTIDPTDLGRSYEAIIRINSQSGKGGVAYLMESEFGCQLPKAMHPEFGSIVQNIADKTGKEVSVSEIWKAFETHYLKVHAPFDVRKLSSQFSETDKSATCELKLTYKNKPITLKGKGNGPIDACKKALESIVGPFSILNYHEHALSAGSASKAIAYIQIQKDNKTVFGVGIHENISKASLLALLNGVNRVSYYPQTAEC